MYLSSCVTLNCLIIDENFLCQDMNIINCLFYFIYLIFNKVILFYLFYFIYFIFKEMFIYFFFLHTYILYIYIYHNNLHCNIKIGKM